MLQPLNPGRSSVLIVEDDPDSALFIAHALERFGIKKVVEAGTAEEALAWLAKHRCDVILVDYNLPGMNGLRLLEHIQDSCPDTRTIVVTGVGDEAVAVSAMKLGAADYVSKDEMLTSGIIRSLQAAFREQRSSRADERRSALAGDGSTLAAAEAEAEWLLESLADDSARDGTVRSSALHPENGGEDWSTLLDQFHRYIRQASREFPSPALSQEHALIRTFMERGSSPMEVVRIYRAALRSLLAEGGELSHSPTLCLLRLLFRLVEQYQLKVSFETLKRNNSDTS